MDKYRSVWGPDIRCDECRKCPLVKDCFADKSLTLDEFAHLKRVVRSGRYDALWSNVFGRLWLSLRVCVAQLITGGNKKCFVRNECIERTAKNGRKNGIRA